MLDYQSIHLSDREWVDECNRRSDFRGCEYAFGTIFLWQFVYQTQIARFKDFLIVRSGLDKKSFLFPSGSGDLKEAIMQMAQDAEEMGQPLCIHGVNLESKAKLEALFPDVFEFRAARDSFDYIYLTEKLTTLSGKKLHGKRNHINRFLQTYEGRWSYEPINHDNIGECYQMNKLWCAENDCMLDDDKLGEQCAVAQAFRYFFDLNLKGGLIRVDGKVVAFCMGEPLNSDTFVVHIEKAFADIQGAYPMINQQFVIHTCQDYQYINREEDTGAEGLRKAKLSYRPVFLEEKYYATARKGEL